MIEIYIFLVLLLLFSNIFFIYKFKKVSNKYYEIIKNPRAQTEELTDFLHDQQNYCYSFVRVDPASVFIRSQK